MYTFLMWKSSPSLVHGFCEFGKWKRPVSPHPPRVCALASLPPPAATDLPSVPYGPVIPKVSRKWLCRFAHPASCTQHAASAPHPPVGCCEISSLCLVLAGQPTTVFIGSPTDGLPRRFRFGNVIGKATVTVCTRLGGDACFPLSCVNTQAWDCWSARI